MQPTPSRARALFPCLCRLAPLAWLVPLWLACAAPARANDRPFQYARTAIEEDDEQVGSFETWAQRHGSVRALSFEPEYSFTTRSSVQLELTRLVDRVGAETGHEAEIEFKQLFNNIARDGYGWGLSAAVSAQRLRDDGRTVGEIGLKLPVSLALWQGEGFLHLDGGVNKASDSHAVWSTSAGLERPVFKRSLLFAELAHEGDLKFVQVGLRHWLHRDKLALDVSAQQQRQGGERATGFVIGLGWYDL